VSAEAGTWLSASAKDWNARSGVSLGTTCIVEGTLFGKRRNDNPYTGVMPASLVAFGRALSDPSRVAMLLELFDQPGATLGALARAAGIASSTASEHLDQLEDAGLITRTRSGRAISVQFASDATASMIEQLLAFHPDTVPLRSTTKIGKLRCARSCYDHLAGRLGVNLCDLLVSVGVLDAHFAPTSCAAGWLKKHLDLDLASLQLNPSKRPLVRPCLDWTEQRPHIAGRLGTELLVTLHRHAWIVKDPSDRSLWITQVGQGALAALNVDLR
jgi:DNA-binding transcriptional ArsR family regulator